MNMNKKSALLEAAYKLWPARHRHFEEMSALAATGQLGGAQMWELNRHIAACDSCREFLESVSQVSVQAMPLLADSRTPAADIVLPEGMRARFLSRVAAADVNRRGDAVLRPFSVQRPLVVSSDRRHSVEKPIDADGGSHATRSSVFPLLWRSAAALAACAAIGIGGFYLGQRRVKQLPQQITQIGPSSTPMPEGNFPVGDADRLSRLERQKTALENELAQLKQELSGAKTERESLIDELAAAREKLEALTTQAQSASLRTAGEVQEARSQMATLQAQVDRLSQRLAESDVALAIHKQTSEELTAKLAAADADLQLERDLKSAKLELGDLVAARNLHIVDVYDADPNGKRQRSFGRVFYIEGKSLVFYAYDLDAPGPFKANVVFHVWGGRAGVKEVTHSLGILHKDDGGQSRWAMTFDDPKVLAQINSVFVTAEPANKHYDEPHGKKVLYAYFGSQPNHP